MRDRERGTGSHSTIRVDGRDQFRLWGAFRSGPLPEVRLRYARERAVEASVLLPGGIRHIRRVEWDAAAGEVLVFDTLDGKGTHEVESRLAWAPITTPFELEAIGGAEVNGERAWTAERIGEAVESTATVARLRAELPAQLGWRLRLQ